MEFHSNKTQSTVMDLNQPLLLLKAVLFLLPHLEHHHSQLLGTAVSLQLCKHLMLMEIQLLQLLAMEPLLQQYLMHP